MATIKIQGTDGKEYSLTFTLRSVRQMSDNGFNLDEARNNPIVGIPKLFAGAFIANHRTASKQEIDDLWKQIPDKESFITTLVELYNEPVDILFGEPEEEAKKAKWEVIK